MSVDSALVDEDKFVKPPNKNRRQMFLIYYELLLILILQ